MLHNDALELVNFYDSGEYQKVVKTITSNNLIFQDQVYRDFIMRVNNGEFVSSVNDAKNFLQELKIRNIHIEQPNFKLPQKECLTCK